MYGSRFIPVLVAIALVLGPGCGRQETPLGSVRPVPTAQDEGGWPVYEQPADGFALSLPPGWTALNLDPKTLDRTLEQGLRVNPGLKAMEQSIRQQAATGVKFLGTEKASGGPNVNVVKVALQGEASLEAAGAAMVKQFESIPSVEKPVARRRVRLQPGEAERLDAIMPVTPPGEETKRLTLAAYVLVRGQQMCVVTCTAGVEEAKKYAPIFDRIVNSFRFLGD
jgi:hypothetical protein